MYFLFIDTSSSNFLALFRQESEGATINLIERREPPEKASFIQAHIYELLSSHGLELSQIECLYYGAGPGSYTGMRITQGLVGTLEILGLKVSGIYLYEVLASSDIWISNAFKAEYFISQNNESKLTTIEQTQAFLEENQNSGHIYSHNTSPLKGIDIQTLSIFDLICKDFSLVIENAGKRVPYYYRPLEVEFSKSRP